MNHKSEKKMKGILNNYIRVFKILSHIDIKMLVFIILLSIINGIIPIISVRFTQSIINMIQTLNFPIKILIKTLLLYIIFNLVAALITLINQYLTTLFQYKIDQYMETLILTKAGNLTLSDFEYTESYNKIQRAQDSNRLYTYFSYIITVLNSFVTLIFSIYILLTWRWWSIIILCAVYLLSTMLINKLSKLQYEMIRKRTSIEREKWYYKFLLTNDMAFKEIKLYKLARYFIKKFNSKSLTTTSSGGLLLPLQRGIVTAHPTGWCRKHFYWSAYKAVLLESSFLDSSACSLIYFCTASSVILPIVST